MSPVQTPPRAGQGGLRARLRDLLLEKIESGKLVLPALPSTAAKVVECLESGRNENQIPALLEGDPALALEVLRLANSASFAARAPITSVSHAATMLGMSRVRSVLMTAVARQVFISRNKRIRDITGALWSHSVAVATVARQIAVRAGFEDKEGPYLAGLMHDIGKPVVAIHLLDLERSIDRAKQDRWIDPNEWLNIVQELHRSVGIAVVKHWNMSSQVCAAVKDCVEFDPVDRLSAANAVRVANALAKREGVYAGEFDADQIDTVLMIGRSLLGLDDNAIDSLCEALRNSAASASMPA